ncbi:BBE domain-containing protein [Solwaraspora sp. WMMD1047]|uniref:BBE domain-containing protein n=1 Tax=Solwaraspora sp. WMMD1047 TaxID=3016102 RepID=UPI00241650C7|nr:BBE domain-containing protein [Solwaraspora sp. WMMD1047]MDG4831312.1 BBE domain-containing protein [Solwaraspora sp. WMMD1047]
MSRAPAPRSGSPFRGAGGVPAAELAPAEAVRRAYPAHTYQRLTRFKKAYDPRNLFRINHNLPPGPRYSRSN